MHSLLILVIFGCFMVRALSRPSRMEEGNDSEGEETAEYESGGASDGAEADDSLREDNEAAPNEQESAADGQENEANQNQRSQEYGEDAELRQASSDERSDASMANSDSFSDSKAEKTGETQDEKADEAINSDKQYESLLQHRQVRYNENNDANDEGQSAQHLTNHDVNNVKLQRNDDSLVNKRIFGSRTASNEDGDYLFENNENKDQVNKAAIRGYNNGPGETKRYLKQYYKTAQVENKDDKPYENLNMYANRDRRQAQDSTPKDTINLSNTPTEKEDLENSATEDEEAAIKRHVRKLSGDELQELLNSLSQDKRELLKKIMESDNEENNKDAINKREITKKAGAVEENGLESSQSDSKLQVGSSSMDIDTGTSSSVPSDPSKSPDSPLDINDITSAKTGVTTNGLLNLENKVDIMKGVDEQQGGVSSCAPISDTKNQVSLDQNIQATTKTDYKREANLYDRSDMDLSFDNKMLENDFSLKETQYLPNEQEYFCPQDDDLSRLMDEESQLHDSNGNTYKREAFSQKDADLANSIKSLEESFPNSNAYDDADPYAGLDMAPLVRVKRKNKENAVKKRAADLLPDAKVAYLPYRAENDDEDTDEGNEFDEEGFYDRTSSLAKNNANEKPELEKSLNSFETPSRFLKSARRNLPPNVINRSKLSQSDNIESDTMSLGSDTDSVLSGVEGVDDNLMFSSGARNRRTVEEAGKVEAQAGDTTGTKQNRPLRSTPFMEEEMKTPENYISAPKYQESDAFGPLPHNYEGELSRYKRIRRVKQPPADQEIAAHS